MMLGKSNRNGIDFAHHNDFLLFYPLPLPPPSSGGGRREDRAEYRNSTRHVQYSFLDSATSLYRQQYYMESTHYIGRS